MRTLTAAVLLAAVAAARADDAGKAAVVVDRAVKLIGGEKKLADLKAGVWKTAGQVQGRQSRAEFHGELPGKFRIDSDRVIDGKPARLSRIVDGDKGWVVEGDTTRPMTKAEIDGVRSSFYHKQAATTLIPLKHPDCRLTSGGRVEVNGKPVDVVRAARKGFPELTLYFDAETGLLAKSEMTDTDARTGRPRKVELEFAAYKEFDGIKMASRTKTYHDGKLFLEVEITEFKGAAGLPAGTFAP